MWEARVARSVSERNFAKHCVISVFPLSRKYLGLAFGTEGLARASLFVLQTMLIISVLPTDSWQVVREA